jgi:uncharacterized OB-fold protein
MPAEGVVKAATTLRVPLPQVDAPYVVGFIELSNGIVVFSRLAAGADDPPAPGTPARVVAQADGGWLTEVSR